MSRERRLLLVRHGLPDYRSGQAGDEPPGPLLSELGYVQARQAADRLADCGAVAIHSSPLARALQTAACVRDRLRVPLAVESELKEWHRTESLYDVSVRSARWLARWWDGAEPVAVVVGHASPLLAILRTALYLPHAGWYRRGQPDHLELSTCDRFEVSMASIFALTLEPERVTAELLFHPQPRIVDARRGRRRDRFPRPLLLHGENNFVLRPNFGRLVGCCPRVKP